MKIGIIGGGVVGRALARCYMEYAEVMVHDCLPERSTHSLEEALDVGSEGLVFICLPTPTVGKGMTLNTGIIEEFFKVRSGSDNNFVLKSTVPIGTTKYLRARYDIENLVHSPEFLTARCAPVDCCLPTRNIVGGTFNRAASILVNLYDRRFPGVPILTMSSDASEGVKLFTNSFFAVKVSFFNELYQIAGAAGIDWELVLGGMISDGRIAPFHTQVPGPDGIKGFGGSCLPKDIAELAFYAETVLGLEPGICKACIQRNKADRG